MASGAGTNFQHVIDCIARGSLALSIAGLVCNRAGAPVLEKAKAAGVPSSLLIWDRAAMSRAQFDRRIFAAVAEIKPDVVLLLGWMHILSSEFIAGFGDLINIHPAFLPLDARQDTVTMPDGSSIPAFRGAHSLAAALAARSPWTGATAHLVSVDVDRGPVLAREAMALRSEDTLESAYARLRPIEHRVLEAGIAAWLTTLSTR